MKILGKIGMTKIRVYCTTIRLLLYMISVSKHFTANSGDGRYAEYDLPGFCPSIGAIVRRSLPVEVDDHIHTGNVTYLSDQSDFQPSHCGSVAGNTMYSYCTRMCCCVASFPHYTTYSHHRRFSSSHHRDFGRVMMVDRRSSGAGRWVTR